MNLAIEIRHLRYFLAVAETANFTRAAERLGVSQPSVSQQLKELEKKLGTPLFARLGKEVRLTDAGAAFRQHAEVVVRKLDEACGSVGQVTGLVRGHLEVGVIPALHLAWVPKVLGRLAADHSGLSVAVHEKPTRAVERDVESGRIALGLGIMTRSSPNLRYERLVTEPFVLIARDDHAFARRRSVDTKELADTRLILLPETFDIRLAIDEHFLRAKLRPKVAFEIDTIDATLAAVHAARTPTILPRIVLDGRASDGLVALELGPTTRTMDFGLIWRRGNETSPPARLFAETLRSSLAGRKTASRR
ncbi:MAG: LysR substrate-binding domain-containing protein [Planctomycetes bacterium]|nr:LysR substrate-binding domain-containing protein [Planctomycetota bacterium]